MNREKNLESYSSRFRDLMRESGKDKDRREDVGKMLGVSGPTVTYWYNGNRLPTMKQAIVIADFFGVTVEWLMTGEGAKYQQKDKVSVDPVHDRVMQFMEVAKKRMDESKIDFTKGEEARLYKVAVDYALDESATIEQVNAFVKKFTS